MALILEDGTGVADASSYISEVDAQAMALLYGLTLPAVVADAEIALRQGYLNLNTHEAQLQGARYYSVQTGIFPRFAVYANGFLLDVATIPNDLILAQLYAASAISGGVDTNAVDNGQNLASFDVADVYSESYQDGARVKVNSRIQGVYNSLQQYYKSALVGGQNHREFEWLT
jgi:hypothetical protein